MMTMTPDEAREFLSLMRGIFDDHAIAQMEDTLAQGGVDTFPGPNTAHPALTHCADSIRRFDLDVVRIPGRVRVTYDEGRVYPTADDVMPIVTLSRRKWVGAVPFVGDPLRERVWYWWWVWTDGYGRHVASHSELKWFEAES